MAGRSRLRTTAAALGLVVLAGLGVLATGVAPADAGLTSPTTPCLYTVSPGRLPPGGGTVTVAGTAPGDAEVRIFVNGVFKTSTRSDSVTGAWSVSFALAQTSEITVAIDDYPATECGVDSAAQALINARSLPRTGGSHIERDVLLGLALVLVGAVLVVAVRRRDHVRGRN
jgi:hypothetical protein